MAYSRFGRSPLGPTARLPGDSPLTWIVLGANAITFLVRFVTGGAVWSPLVFHPTLLATQPWTVLTYPLVAQGGILWLLLGGYVFWLFGSSLERAWGARDYTIFLGLTTAAAAMGTWIGAGLVGIAYPLAGLWLPLAAAIVAWATINPHERILVYFVIPLEARWLAVIAPLLVVFSFQFPLGLFAAAGCGAAWWYVRYGRYGVHAPAWRRARRSGGENARSWNPFVLWRQWRHRRRFLRLVKRSGLDDVH